MQGWNWICHCFKWAEKMMVRTDKKWTAFKFLKKLKFFLSLEFFFSSWTLTFSRLCAQLKFFFEWKFFPSQSFSNLTKSDFILSELRQVTFWCCCCCWCCCCYCSCCWCYCTFAWNLFVTSFMQKRSSLTLQRQKVRLRNFKIKPKISGKFSISITFSSSEIRSRPSGWQIYLTTE